MERTLIFNYPSEYQDKADQLARLFDEKGIQFKKHDGAAITFTVRKSGYKWNDLYKIVNSVKAARYRFI